ncbi:MAG: hypothetical protein II772_05080, partial [Lachnospiraceae bacterium]|nr:hypothetical protein [Lachnospiraceae bacterium]
MPEVRFCGGARTGRGRAAAVGGGHGFSDRPCGGGGNDALYGEAGNDSILGDAGNDK